jgi:hypothetical protein
VKQRQRAAAGAKPPHGDGEWYASVFSAEEWGLIQRRLESTPDALDAEVAVMRVLIRRVMERLGADDPAQALPLVRQAVDSICRALRAQRVLKGEAADSLAAAIAVALKEIGQEMGIDSGGDGVACEPTPEPGDELAALFVWQCAGARRAKLNTQIRTLVAQRPHARCAGRRWKCTGPSASTRLRYCGSARAPNAGLKLRARRLRGYGPAVAVHQGAAAGVRGVTGGRVCRPASVCGQTG